MYEVVEPVQKSKAPSLSSLPNVISKPAKKKGEKLKKKSDKSSSKEPKVKKNPGDIQKSTRPKQAAPKPAKSIAARNAENKGDQYNQPDVDRQYSELEMSEFLGTFDANNNYQLTNGGYIDSYGYYHKADDQPQKKKLKKKVQKAQKVIDVEKSVKNV